jgi:hypothetical protein
MIRKDEFGNDPALRSAEEFQRLFTAAATVGCDASTWLSVGNELCGEDVLVG